MKKLARVLFSYNPINNDELKLSVGQLIEVLSEEEEGWWRGKLDGQEGVFPSNFVELTTDSSHSPSLGLSNQYVNQNAKSNSNNNNNNNNNNKSAIIGTRSQMDSQQHHDDDSQASGERKPKPVRGVGFGDIFAGGKPKLSPVDGISTGGDRHNSNNNSINNLGGSAHKAIPKKPPPPAPVPESNSDSSSEAAPVLPPKPSSAQLSSLNQPGSHTPASFYNLKHQTPPSCREQAKVIYNYEAQNSDELTIEEGDIINVISKQIEDQGWWKGELNGQIGVFPDNFVELIKVPIPPQDQAYTPDLLPLRMQKPSRPPPVVIMGAGSMSMVMPTDSKNPSLAYTPKGLSRDLETNSDRGSVGSSASFLSLNRNKFGVGPSSSSKPPVAAKSPINVAPSSLTPSGKTESTLDGRDQYGQSKDSSPLSLGMGGRTQASNNNSFDSFASSDSNCVQAPGKLNHLTAQRAKGPSSRRPPSYILAARDNVADNSMDSHQNGDIKDVVNHSRSSSNIAPCSLNQSSLTLGLSSTNNNGTSQQTTAINASMNSQQTNNKSVTPPSTLKSIDSNQNGSSSKTQKSPQQPKETTPTAAVPHWMVELRATKKAHSEKAEKKRDSTTEEPSPNNNIINNPNAKQIESPNATAVAPVKSSPPFINREQAYQQTPTSSLTGGVKNLTSRYSGDFTLSDKGNSSAPQQNQSSDPAGSNEYPPGALYKQQSSINASLHGKSSNNINNRQNFAPSVLSRQDSEGSSQRASLSGSTSHLAANSQTVPTSNNISSTPPSIHGSNILSNHANSNQVQGTNSSNHQLQNSSQNPGGNKFFSKNNSPSDSSINDIHFNSAQQNLLTQQQQQIVLNNSEIESLKEEIKRLKEESRKAPTKSDFDSLANQVNDLRSLIENQKKTHGNLIKDLINDLADERKKTATMQIEIDRLQKLTSAV